MRPAHTATPCIAATSRLDAVTALCKQALVAAALLPWALPAPVMAQASDAPSRGQLLYEAHCVQCHTTQVHWREARAARDWPGVRAQVQRWQSQIGEQWPQEDVDAVAQYLNSTIYHYPVTREQAAAPGGVVASRGSAAR